MVTTKDSPTRGYTHGIYRLIDFALSNLVNAGFLRIAVLTQYKSHSLDRHIATSWRLSPLLGNYVTPVPAQPFNESNEPVGRPALPPGTTAGMYEHRSPLWSLARHAAAVH